jgi:hypothetical protein
MARTIRSGDEMSDAGARAVALIFHDDGVPIGGGEP